MLFGKKKDNAPSIFTEQQCNSCGERTRRNFSDGDYVFKTRQQCPRCSSNNGVIVAVYGEYPPEKEKT
ncbi:MAG TPA: hypothetical protein VFA15_01545 [Nitrososphaera sp.]|nr:hypothetical protein [Nitrososphaera sp.]